MRRLLIVVIALAISTQACAQFSFRTTGETTTTVLNMRPSNTLPETSQTGWGKLFVAGPSLPGYSPGEWYVSQNGGAWVKLFQAIGGGGGAVSSFNGRTGVVTAAIGDYNVSQVTGAAPLASPTFTGTPAAPTPATADNTTKIATTAFVKAQGYVTSATAPVTSVAGKTGAVTLSVADVTGALSTATAASTYLTQANAASTYLAQTSAASTYAPITNAAHTGTFDWSNGSNTYATFTAAGGGIALRTAATGQASTLALADGTTTKWLVGKQANNTFSIWNSALGASALSIDNASNATFAANLGVTGTTTLTGAAALNGGATVTGAFSLTNGTANTYAAFNNNGGGVQVNAPTAGQAANVLLSDAGTSKWSVYKATDNTFGIFNHAAGQRTLAIDASHNVGTAGSLYVGTLAATGTGSLFETYSTGGQVVRFRNNATTGGADVRIIDGNGTTSSRVAKLALIGDGSPATTWWEVGLNGTAHFVIRDRSSLQDRLTIDASNGNAKFGVGVSTYGRTTPDGVVTDVSFSASNFTVAGGTSPTWTVNSGNVAAYYYTVVGKQMTMTVFIQNAGTAWTMTGSPTQLKFAIPGGFTAARDAVGSAIWNNSSFGYWNSSPAAYAKVSGAAGTVVLVEKVDGSTWQGTLYGLQFTITFPIN